MKWIFVLLIPFFVNAADNKETDEPTLIEKVDKSLLDAQKNVKKKLSEIDDDMTKASKDFNKNVFGKKGAKKKEEPKSNP
jgi:hypothetical protein